MTVAGYTSEKAVGVKNHVLDDSGELVSIPPTDIASY